MGIPRVRRGGRDEAPAHVRVSRNLRRRRRRRRRRGPDGRPRLPARAPPHARGRGVQGAGLGERQDRGHGRQRERGVGRRRRLEFLGVCEGDHDVHAPDAPGARVRGAQGPGQAQG